MTHTTVCNKDFFTMSDSGEFDVYKDEDRYCLAIMDDIRSAEVCYLDRVQLLRLARMILEVPEIAYMDAKNCHRLPVKAEHERGSAGRIDDLEAICARGRKA